MRNKLDLTSLLQTWRTQSFTYTLRFSFQCVGITIDIMLQTLSVNNGVIACHHNLLRICQSRHATCLLKLFSYNLATTTYTCQQFILTSLICLVATSLFQSPKNLLQVPWQNNKLVTTCQRAQLLQACSANNSSTSCEIYTCIWKLYWIHRTVLLGDKRIFISLQWTAIDDTRFRISIANQIQSYCSQNLVECALRR